MLCSIQILSIAFFIWIISPRVKAVYQRPVPTDFSCHLEANWAGSWYDAESDPMLITNNSISTKGICVQQTGNRYLFKQQRRAVECWRCLIIFNRNENVLQYKESGCATAKRICDAHSIPGDAILSTLFRASAISQPCPISSAFTFSYSDPWRSCKSRHSRGSVCADKHSFQLSYENCQEDESANRVELIKCFGTWSNGHRHFFYGELLSDLHSSAAIRCFTFTTPGMDRTFMLGRSVDQTCKDLNEQSEIPVQILAIPDVTNGGRCQFPSWLQTAIDEWTSLDGRHHYTFSSSKWLQKDDNQIQIMMECVEHLEDLGHLQQYIVTRTHDCSTFYRCVTIHRRTKRVADFELGSETEVKPISCDTQSTEKNPLVTILATHSGSEEKKCPFVGKYELGSCEDLSGLSLHIGCDETQRLTTVYNCSHITEYHCVAHWRHSEFHFLVLQQFPHSRSTFCLVYQMTDEVVVNYQLNRHACQYDRDRGDENKILEKFKHSECESTPYVSEFTSTKPAQFFSSSHSLNYPAIRSLAVVFALVICV